MIDNELQSHFTKILRYLWINKYLVTLDVSTPLLFFPNSTKECGRDLRFLEYWILITRSKTFSNPSTISSHAPIFKQLIQTSLCSEIVLFIMWKRHSVLRIVQRSLYLLSNWLGCILNIDSLPDVYFVCLLQWITASITNPKKLVIYHLSRHDITYSSTALMSEWSLNLVTSLEQFPILGWDFPETSLVENLIGDDSETSPYGDTTHLPCRLIFRLRPSGGGRMKGSRRWASVQTGISVYGNRNIDLSIDFLFDICFCCTGDYAIHCNGHSDSPFTLATKHIRLGAQQTFLIFLMFNPSQANTWALWECVHSDISKTSLVERATTHAVASSAARSSWTPSPWTSRWSDWASSYSILNEYFLISYSIRKYGILKCRISLM